MDISGYGKNFPVLFGRQSGCNQGAAFFSRFDNDRTQRHVADNPVSDGEIVGIRLGFEREFGDHRSGFANSFEKLSGGEIRNIVLESYESINTFLSAIYDRATTMDKEYLVLEYDIKAKRLIKDLADTYFTLKKMGEKEFKKISRDQVKIFGWKNVDLLEKNELIIMLNNMKKNMENIWTAQKYNR